MPAARACLAWAVLLGDSELIEALTYITSEVCHHVPSPVMRQPVAGLAADPPPSCSPGTRALGRGNGSPAGRPRPVWYYAVEQSHSLIINADCTWSGRCWSSWWAWRLQAMGTGRQARCCAATWLPARPCDMPSRAPCHSRHAKHSSMCCRAGPSSQQQPFGLGCEAGNKQSLDKKIANFCALVGVSLSAVVQM